MAAIWYTTPSRPVRDQIGRPKPTENLSTRTPQRRATQKCPSSCHVTNRPIVTTNQKTEPNNCDIDRPYAEQRTAPPAPGTPPPGRAPRRSVARKQQYKRYGVGKPLFAASKTRAA